MTDLVAIPNVSEGRNRHRIRSMVDVVERAGAAVLDVHSDSAHNRSVLTVAGEAGALVTAMTDLADACLHIDLTSHAGVHPRLGGLDVCPIVPHEAPMEAAVGVARSIACSIGGRIQLPVYLYGAAARRAETVELPDIRRSGLQGLIERSKRGFAPDAGPSEIDPARGVVCVGARQVLIAFNVWVACPQATARTIASSVRTSGGGRPGIRALGFAIEEPRLSQVSMNLLRPDETGIDEAFQAVATAAAAHGTQVVSTEIVGLVPGRYLPRAGSMTGKLLMEPARSLESALKIAVRGAEKSG